MMKTLINPLKPVIPKTSAFKRVARNTLLGGMAALATSAAFPHKLNANATDKFEQQPKHGLLNRFNPKSVVALRDRKFNNLFRCEDQIGPPSLYRGDIDSYAQEWADCLGGPVGSDLYNMLNQWEIFRRTNDRLFQNCLRTGQTREMCNITIQEPRSPGNF